MNVTRKSTRNRAGRRKTPVALATDIGMTGLRAVLMGLWWLLGRGKDPIIIPCGDRNLAHDDGDHPGIAYAFEINKPPSECIGHSDSTRSFPFPLKMYFYLVRVLELYILQEWKKARDILLMVPHLKLFMDELDEYAKRGGNRMDVINHLTAIFHVWMHRFRQRAESVAEKHNLVIVKLVFTIPANWDMGLQEQYKEIIREIYPHIPDENTYMISESLSVGHWLLSTKEYWRASRINQVCVVDFGGHTLSWHVMQLLRCHISGQFKFFAIGKEYCEHGGAEFHSCLLKKELSNLISERGMTFEDGEEDHLVSDCMRDYCQRYRAKADGSPIFLRGAKSPGSTPEIFEFSASFCRGIYKQAFQKPQKALHDYLRLVRQWATEKGVRVAVVLTGGSFQNSFVRNKTQVFVKSIGLENDNSEDLRARANHRSSIVSMGAAYAIVATKSCKEFISKAAFAINTQGQNRMLRLVMDKGKPHKVHVSAAESTNMMIACAPLAPSSGTEVDIRNTYDFLSIGRDVMGKCTVEMWYDEDTADDEAETGWLHLQVQHDVRGKHPQFEKIKLPIFFDGGYGVVLNDNDKVHAMTDSELTETGWDTEQAQKWLQETEEKDKKFTTLHWEDGRGSSESGGMAMDQGAVQKRRWRLGLDAYVKHQQDLRARRQRRGRGNQHVPEAIQARVASRERLVEETSGVNEDEAMEGVPQAKASDEMGDLSGIEDGGRMGRATRRRVSQFDPPFPSTPYIAQRQVPSSPDDCWVNDAIEAALGDDESEGSLDPYDVPDDDHTTQQLVLGSTPRQVGGFLTRPA
ncbi:hypothetical protein G7046_g9848 [Stylonectria norvegica]|nr:hypothetical protein G7046_g9848 [Stylonectria norvegica]